MKLWIVPGAFVVTIIAIKSLRDLLNRAYQWIDLFV